MDVAAIDIGDLIGSIVHGAGKALFGAITSHELYGGDNPVHVEAGTDVLVAGFRYGFHDSDFLFPIVKSGIVSSAWGFPWQGLPRFLIDSRLFTGSSGSVVTTTPQQFAAANGMMLHAPKPTVALLGIYSGAFRVPSAAGTDPLDLGVVWYADTILHVIDAGVGFAQATSA